MWVLASVDAFAVIMLGGTALLIIALMLLGAYHPRSGADVLRWEPTRSPEAEAQNEVDDIAQMIEAANERRRRLGKPEKTLEQVEMSVMEAQQERARLASEAAERDADIDDMLALKNARRERKGLPPLTREQYEADLKLP
jgi:septal ring factor EnvC (AmiA/AmiB activator)